MKPEDFKSWRQEMGFTQAQAAKVLGVSTATIENYEKGSRREDGRTVHIPLSIALACSAIYHRLEPWKSENGG